MGIMNNYADDTVTTAADKFLGTDSGGATKNTTAATLKTFVNTDPTFTGTVTLPTNSIEAADLATNAITLGHASITSSFSTTSTTVVQVTGLSAVVTIPAGSRRIRISAYCPNLGSSSSPKVSYLSIWDGTVGSGTQLQEVPHIQAALQTPFSSACLVSTTVTPAAGSKTYNVGLRSDGGGGITSWMTLGVTTPAYILVEAI